MNNIKIITALFCLMLISSFGIAQGNCIKVYKGAAGCGCKCLKDCVSEAELPVYLADGWNTVGCWNCCKAKNWVDADNLKTSLDEVNNNTQPGMLTVSFTLAEESDIKLEVTDMTGRCIATIADEFREDIDNELLWDTSELTPGMYFLTLEAGEHRETKMISITE